MLERLKEALHGSVAVGVATPVSDCLKGPCLNEERDTRNDTLPHADRYGQKCQCLNVRVREVSKTTHCTFPVFGTFHHAHLTHMIIHY